jgi:hypothetical protein
VVLEVDVPRSWLRRSSRRHVWNTPRDIPPERIRLRRADGEQAVLPVAPVHLPDGAEDAFAQRPAGAGEPITTLVQGWVAVGHPLPPWNVPATRSPVALPRRR